jgi:integrase
MGRSPRGHNGFLSREEAKRLIVSITADENRMAANAIILLLLTGARRNEVTMAKWQFVDWDRRVLLVPISKSGKPVNQWCRRV